MFWSSQAPAWFGGARYSTLIHKRLAELADVCGIPGKDQAEKANAFLSWIEETNKKMGLPQSFSMIGMRIFPR